MNKPRAAAGGVVLHSTDRKIVLVWQGGNSWSFPKGGIDEGETPYEAARREVWEETGLTDLTLVCELPTYLRRSIGKGGVGEDMSRPPAPRTLFLFTTRENTLKPQEPDVTEARFVTIDEALALLTHPKDVEFLRSIKDIIEKHV